MNKHILVEIMSQLTPLTQEEEIAIESSFPIRTVDKGQYLLKEGHVAKDGYFILEGLITEYKVIDGEKKSTAFYIENESVINFESITNQTPSKVNFVCTEKTKLAVVNAEKEDELYRKHPRFETFCRSGVEQMLGSKHDLLVDILTLKPEDRYLKLQQERPELINRLPQYQIASYLGIKPETLSRIRTRLALKSKQNII